MAATLIDPTTYRVKPGTKVKLPDWPTRTTNGFDGGKEAAATLLPERNTHLGDLQQMLYAEGKHKMLVVLQGMDTAGKDGTIRHVFRDVNPLGVQVANFKAPTTRSSPTTTCGAFTSTRPANGELVIFNRSHYEDVLVVRVHDLVPEKVWSVATTTSDFEQHARR